MHLPLHSHLFLALLPLTTITTPILASPLIPRSPQTPLYPITTSRSPPLFLHSHSTITFIVALTYPHQPNPNSNPSEARDLPHHHKRQAEAAATTEDYYPGPEPTGAAVTTEDYYPGPEPTAVETYGAVPTDEPVAWPTEAAAAATTDYY